MSPDYANHWRSASPNDSKTIRTRGLRRTSGCATSNSESCGTARTLTVWESEDAMLDFVLGDAHTAAMAETARISRGGSLTMTATADSLDEISWDAAAALFADHDGPVY